MRVLTDPASRARTALGVILALPLIFAIVATALAHSWYPSECCSDNDCYPKGDAGREPDPVATPSGWRLHDGVIIPFAAARPSPDGQFHVCRSGGARDGSLIRPYEKPPCLWAPQPAT